VDSDTPKDSLSPFFFLPIFVHSLDKYSWILFTAFIIFLLKKKKKIVYFLVPTSEHKVCILKALAVRNRGPSCMRWNLLMRSAAVASNMGQRTVSRDVEGLLAEAHVLNLDLHLGNSYLQTTSFVLIQRFH
jgi:hypothetical protein